jgi:Fur family ferric uptake transcriptional regulator
LSISIVVSNLQKVESRSRHHTPARTTQNHVRGAAEILAARTDRDIPATAQDLSVELRLAGLHLGIASIYRALHALRDQDALHEFTGLDGTAYRACCSQPHYHLICLTCRRIQEQPIPTRSNWLTSFDTEGFTPQTVLIEVYGTCTRCHAHR